MLHGDQRAVLVVTLDGDDLARELALDGGLVRELVRAHPHPVLVLAADAVEQAQVLGGHAHHARGLGHVQAHARIHVHVVHHRQVAEVLHATDEVHVAHAGLDVRRRRVQRRHRRAAEAVDGLRRDREGQLGAEHDQAREVHALLAALQHAAPDQVVDLGGIELVVARQQALHDGDGQVVGAHVAEAAVLRAAHGAAGVVDDDGVSCVHTHVCSSSAQ